MKINKTIIKQMISNQRNWVCLPNGKWYHATTSDSGQVFFEGIEIDDSWEIETEKDSKIKDDEERVNRFEILDL